MSPQKRVFSEQETSEVLQKAAKLQEAASDAAYTPGITRSELDRIASEAGIDTKFVEQALGEIQTTKPKRSWLNLSEEFERVVDGEVDPDDFDQILLDLKPVGHRHGLQQVGRTVSMQTYYKGAVCQVEMTSRKGRTRIKVKSVPLMAYFFSLHPALILGIVAGVNIGARGPWLIGCMVFFFSMLAGIMGFSTLVKKGHSSAQALVDVLEKRVEDHTSQLRENLVKSRPAPVAPVAEVEQLQDMPG
jgi:hypothetical protein